MKKPRKPILNKALLILDYIKGIASGRGVCTEYLAEHPEIIENTNSAIIKARSSHIPIFHVRLAFDSSYNGLPKHAPFASTIRDNHRFLLNTEATEFIPEISKKPTDTIINKTYGDAFKGNQLMQELKKQNIEEIIFTGVSTDNAVLNSANTAMLNDFYVTILKDACGAQTATAHESALKIMSGRTASEITTTSDFLKKLLN